MQVMQTMFNRRNYNMRRKNMFEKVRLYLMVGLIFSSVWFLYVRTSVYERNHSSEENGIKPLISLRSQYEVFNRRNETVWKSPFYFVHGSDPQLGLSFESDIINTKKMIKKINNIQPKPKFFAITGDFGHNTPTTVHRDEYERLFKEFTSELDQSIPLIFACGNNDMSNRPSDEDVKHFRSIFGNDYFSFTVGGVFFIVLNSEYYVTDRLKKFEEEQNQWLEEQLQVISKGAYKHGVVLQHTPWFVKHRDEIYNKHKYISPEKSEKMLSIFSKAGIKKVFCGHTHVSSSAYYGDLEVVVTSAIGVPFGPEKPGVRIVSVYEQNIIHKYYSLDDIPSTFEL